MWAESDTSLLQHYIASLLGLRGSQPHCICIRSCSRAFYNTRTSKKVKLHSADTNDIIMQRGLSNLDYIKLKVSFKSMTRLRIKTHYYILYLGILDRRFLLLIVLSELLR